MYAILKKYDTGVQKMLDSFGELAIISKGGISYSELKRMSPKELRSVERAMTRYLKAKAKAYGGKGSKGNLVG